MRKVRFVIEYWIVLFFYRLIRLLPHCAIAFFARIYGWIAWHMPVHRKLILANIRAAMPEKSPAEAAAIGRKSCFYLFLNLIEFIWVTGIPHRIEQCYEMPPDVKARLTAHREAGERIIFVNPHLGSWEASGQMAPFYAGIKMVAIAKPVRNPYLNRLLNQGNREKCPGLSIIFAKGAIRAATKALRDGLGVGTLIDQNTKMRDGGVFVRFFGLPVASSKAPASLKRYCDAHGIPAVIIYGTSVRTAEGKVRAYAEWLPRDFSTYPSDEAVIEELMRISERYIRKYPEQYLWLYKRFMYIPPDAGEAETARFPDYAKLASGNFFGRKHYTAREEELESEEPAEA